MIEACKSKGVCLYCSNAGHCIRECTYLLPASARPEVRVFAAWSDSSLSLNKSCTTGVSASRICQIKEALDELDSSDFDK